MGIPPAEQRDKAAVCTTKPHLNKTGVPTADDEQKPPEIPPRMKKKGPELPEKPPHLRLITLTKSLTATIPSSQTVNKSSTTAPNKAHKLSTNEKLFLQNARKQAAGSDREVIVAATKGARERPPERRQREPAKLLTSTFKSTDPEPADNDTLQVLLGLASPKPHRKSGSHPAISNKPVSFKTNSSNKMVSKNSRQLGHPVILIPRSQLDTRKLQQFWASYPMSYSMWVQNVGTGDPQVTSRLVRKAFSPGGSSAVELRPGLTLGSKGPKKSENYPLETKIIVSSKNSKSSGVPSSSSKPRSSSVTRSGSLTSRGSTSSDSGNESFPKSVLKKHKRESQAASNKKTAEHKKNVTFNAFATVQLMEE